MRWYSEAMAAFLLFCFSSPCFAELNCDDWVAKRGYCVDYVKSRIPSFPIPESDEEITRLKNREIGNVAKGDVAIFDLGRYWHVAYVENVYRDTHGNAISIDISEKNYGPQMTLKDYKKKWGSKHVNEWKRAVSCGVTKKYGQTSIRKNVAIDSVDQVWSPTPSASRYIRKRGVAGLMGKAHEFLTNMFNFSEIGL